MCAYEKFKKNYHRCLATVTKISASFKKIGPIGVEIQNFKDK